LITVSGAKGEPQHTEVLKAAPGTSPTTKQLDAMPTSPARLRSFLLTQAKQQLSQAYAEMAQQARKAGKKIPTPFPKGPQPTDNDLVFEQAADLLWEPHLSPGLRAALYKVLANTPGVQVKTGAADTAGRPAVEISRVDTVARVKVETFENPKTGDQQFHHGGQFALTRWTNLYFPASELLWGDPIGGEVGSLFGDPPSSNIADVPVYTNSDHLASRFAHTLYWKCDAGRLQPHIEVLKAAIDLDDAGTPNGL